MNCVPCLCCVMMELKCAIVVTILVIGMELPARNCCYVCFLNDSQFAPCGLCVLLIYQGGQREGCGLFSMWCFVPMLESKRLCLERMCDIVPGVGCECIVLCCLGLTW